MSFFPSFMKFSSKVGGQQTVALQAKSSPPPIFVNKVLVEFSHAHSFTCFLWLLSHYRNRIEELWEKSYGLQSKMFTLWTYTEKVATPRYMLLLGLIFRLLFPFRCQKIQWMNHMATFSRDIFNFTLNYVFRWCKGVRRNQGTSSFRYLSDWTWEINYLKKDFSHKCSLTSLSFKNVSEEWMR